MRAFQILIHILHFFSEHLHAASNKLRGDFPAFITELSRLEELKLQNNTFSSSMPDDFSSLLDLSKYYDVSFGDSEDLSHSCLLPLK